MNAVVYRDLGDIRLDDVPKLAQGRGEPLPPLAPGRRGRTRELATGVGAGQ